MSHSRRIDRETFICTVNYTDGCKALLAHKGRTSWVGFLRAARIAEEIMDAKPTGVVSITVEPVAVVVLS